MKKLLLPYFLFLLMVASAMAVPVRRGQWRNITLADGSTVKVEAAGDELCHFWHSASGDAYIEQNGVFVKTDVHSLDDAVGQKRVEENMRRMMRFEKNFGNRFGTFPDSKTRGLGLRPINGERTGLILLVEFADIHFTSDHTQEFYKQMLNEGGPESMGYKGSVKQYFIDQSCGAFSIDFDVAPIVQMPENHETYTNGIRDMIRYSIDQIKDDTQYDWSKYDWDGDGEIDMVVVIYAGYGQATKTEDTSLIWPHESSFGYNGPTAGDKVFNTYACVNEIDWNWGEGDKDMGIGTLCHEFAHCLGYPDLYDVCNSCTGVTGMDYWDLLDGGSYAGNGFIPAPLTAFERMSAGWINPREIEVDKEYNLRPITDQDGGDVYIMTNPNNGAELYTFEVIKNEGWCSGLYKSKGLLIVHVDYDENAWVRNVVNCLKYPEFNDHSRFTYIPADGGYEIQNTSQIRGDLYPYVSSDKTQNSAELQWYTGNSNGDTACGIKLCNIKLEEDNTVSFVTRDRNYVEPTLVSSIELSSSSIEIVKNSTYSLTATIYPDNAANKDVTWTSNNEGIATVDQNGNVTAVSIGIAEITVTALDGSGIIAKCTVTVTPQLATNLVFDVSDYSMKVGEYYTIGYTLSPEDCEVKTLEWTSSDNSIVSIVDSEGRIQAKNMGTAIVSARTIDGSDLYAEILISVSPIFVSGIELSMTNIEMKRNTTLSITATLYPDDATYKDLSWTSSDENVAIVDDNGKISAIGIGTAVITVLALDNCSVSTTATVTVIPSDPDLLADYINEKILVLDELVDKYDIEEIKVLIKETQDKLKTLSYDENISLDENKAVVNQLIASLEEEIETIVSSTGITNINNDRKALEIYNINGTKASSTNKGMFIIRDKNGKTKIINVGK